MSEYDPMKGVISSGEGVPPDNYTAKFLKAEYRPAVEADPMTGKGERKYDATRFSWEVLEGTEKGKIATCDTGTATGVKSRFYMVLSWLMGGKAPNPGEPYDLSSCIGKKYLITVGNKPQKQWVEVTHAILMK